MKLTNERLAYLAGLIDGEGSLECQKQIQKNGRTSLYKLRLSFTMATQEPLKTVAEWLNLQTKIYPSYQKNRQPTHRLHIPKELAVILLKNCLPYLILKKGQAKWIIKIEKIRKEYSPSRHHNGKTHFQSMPIEAIQKMEYCHLNLRKLKSNKRPKEVRI